MKRYNDNFWYFDNEDGSYTLGITEEGLDELGEVHQIVLAAEDEELEEDEGCGTLRGKDGYCEVPAPFPLRILARNEDLIETPEMIHDDPSGESWLLKVETL